MSRTTVESRTAPITREEVADVLRERNAAMTAPDLAYLVLMRRGSDTPQDMSRHPAVRQLRSLLEEMASGGLVLRRKGRGAHDLGRVWGALHAGRVYYALAEIVGAEVDARARRLRALEEARAALPELRELAGDRVRDLEFGFDHDSEGTLVRLTLTLTLDQARELLGPRTQH